MDIRLRNYLKYSIGIAGNIDESLDGWTIHTAQRAGEDVGFVITKGPEIHMLAMSEKKAMSRKNIIDFIKPILDEHGFVTTRVPLNETNHRLRVRLGFQLTWQDECYSYWALTKIPYEREVQ